MELRAGRPGKADATRLRGVFQRYSDVNPIALEISVVPDEHVAEMDAHAEQHSPILGYIGVAISGKGILDLMLLIPVGHLSEVCAIIDGMGFQHQSGVKRHPDNRPMREGSFTFDGSVFRLHVHLIPESSAEVDRLRKFRDRLTANPELVALYVEQKRRLIDAQISDRSTYTLGKKAFIESVLKLER